MGNTSAYARKSRSVVRIGIRRRGRADQKIGVGPLDAGGPAGVDVFSGALEIGGHQRLVGERRQIAAKACETLRCAHAAEQFLTDRPDDGDSAFLDQQAEFLYGRDVRASAAPEG